MSLVKFINNYTRFNAWANNEIIQWLQQVDTKLLYQETPSSFKSLDFTLQHILRAQKFWLAFITEKDTTNFNWSVRHNEVENILRELGEVSIQMQEQFALFTEAQLNDTLVLNAKWMQNSLSRYEYIVHVVNHSSFHRGQLITMARTIGITEGIVNTDYNYFNTLNQKK